MKSPAEFNIVVILFFLLKGCKRFGFYGEFCEKPCPRNCRHCHPSTGECLSGCSTGYSGHHCLLYNRGNCDRSNNSLYNWTLIIYLNCTAGSIWVIAVVSFQNNKHTQTIRKQYFCYNCYVFVCREPCIASTHRFKVCFWWLYW